MRLVTASEMRSIDRHAIDTVGIESAILMENAGLKVLFALEKMLGGLRQKKFCIVCGKGNNGGDGLVTARHLFNNQVPVHVFIAARREDLSTETAKNARILEQCGYQPIYMSGIEDLNKLRVALEFSDCTLDALYGTGFSGTIQGYNAEVVNIINEAKTIRVSIDVPSGLCATTGKISSPSVLADKTVTLGLPKRGLYLYPGLSTSGEIWIADIGIPQVSCDAVPGSSALLNQAIASTLLPARPEHSNKGTFGHVLLLAGSQSYQGAGVLTSYGALRSGVGLVTLGLPRSLASAISCDILPDVITRSFKDHEGGFALEPSDVQEFAGVYRTIVAGPGWGKGPLRRKSIEHLLKHWKGSLLLDADALNVVAESRMLSEHTTDLIVTPHVGEMSRLCGKPIPEILEDLPGTAQAFAAKCHCIVVLKSSTPIIANPDGKMFICSRPNSGLAKGGAGDLLSGLIGGLCAQGLPTFQAAGLGVFLHAEAGEIARTELGADAMTVSEMASLLPRAFRRLRGEEPAPGNQRSPSN